MKNRFKSAYMKLTVIFIFISTWFFPGCPTTDGYGTVFGVPFGYLTFYDISNTLWHSTGINLLFLYLDYCIIHYVLRAIGSFIKKLQVNFEQKKSE